MSRPTGKANAMLVMVALLAIAAGCSDAGPTAPPDGVAEVRFIPQVRTVMAWDSIPMTLTITDASGRPVSGRPVIWASEHPNIATVSPAGMVTGVAAGEATITATVDGKKGTGKVQVSWPPVAGLTIDVTQIALEEGAAAQLVARPHDAQGRAITGIFVGWTSSDPGIAQIDYVGGILAIRPGAVQIRATAHGREATALVTVTADHPYDLLYQSFDGTTPALLSLDIRQPAGAPLRLFPGLGAGNVAVSPDGSRLAFVSGGLDAGIWVANRDGSGLREVVIGSRFSPVYQPAWSPDGTKLAYTRRSAQDGGEQIWIVDVESKSTLVTTHDQPGEQSWPSWSPQKVDGTYRLAYAQRAGGTQQIWTMREDGSDARAVTSGALYDGQPAWSPDGQTIAFQRLTVSVFDIWLVDAEGGNERGLTGLYQAGAQSAPAWSPDGLMLAFASSHETYGQEGSMSQIYTVRLNGSGLARRTSGAGDKILPAWVTR